jgi:glycosidase
MLLHLSIFRKTNRALQENASVLLLASNHPDVLVYLCRRQQDRVLVLLNFSKDKADFYFDHPAVPGNYSDLFSNEAFRIHRKKKFIFVPGKYKVYHITNE